MSQKHSCAECRTVFPAGTHPRKKYCNNTCRQRAHYARTRLQANAPDKADVLEAKTAELSRVKAEKTKALARNKEYRRTIARLRSENKQILSARQQSTTLALEKHSELRATYRQAHTLVTQLATDLNLASSHDQPAVLPETSDDTALGTRPEDNDIAANLAQVVATTRRELVAIFNLRQHQPRTTNAVFPRQRQVDLSLSYDAGGQNVASSQVTRNDNATDSQRQLDTANAELRDMSEENEMLRQQLTDATARIGTLHGQMIQAKTAHTKLRDSYRTARATIEQLKRDATGNKRITIQWLHLAKELHRRTGGRPTEARHKEILIDARRYEQWLKNRTTQTTQEQAAK